MRTVAILGAGVAGLVAAHRLRHRAPRDTRVIVIDRDADHVFAPSLLWVANGTRRRSAISRPLSRMSRKGIEFINGTIDAIDVAFRTVRVGDREITADAMIIALGAATDPATIPGLAEHGINIYSPDGAEQINRRLHEIEGGMVTIVTAEPMYKCPAAPYELAFLADHVLRRRGVRSRTRITFLAAEPAPMATAGPEMSEGMRTMLSDRGIEYRPSTAIRRVVSPPTALELGDGTRHYSDATFYVPAHRPPQVLRGLSIAGPSGWLTVDPATLETTADGVYALGDVVAIPLHNGRTLPKAGVFAHAQAEVVARNIAAEFAGQKGTERFDGHGTCFVEVGGGKAAAGSGNFYALPEPEVRMIPPSRWSHFKKVAFEKLWLTHWA